MATTMHKLLQKPLQQTLFPHLKLQNPLNILPSLLHHPPSLVAVPENHNAQNEKKAAIDNRFHVFPSFSFGLFLNPNFSSGLRQIEAVRAEISDLDESQIMWADSVKKKRKKKMNKHKLRKLRKRVRGYA
ncbi:hypothetical protein PHJA_002213000 [Phtheirospermum japonicum]|uniref:Small ribosomal subunit protein mS38 n=1 Tax=Phtheirospermum japonicum TaxID=374723 RepID=A0A830CLK4_9LAMI|nr:hypothetical protein PHJA_002213000 [Phtheirospermum japonicum]